MTTFEIEEIIKHHLKGNYLASQAGITLLAKDIVNYIEQSKQEEDNVLREALIDVQSLILDKDNHKDGCFKEFPLVLSIIKMALNSKKN